MITISTEDNKIILNDLIFSEEIEMFHNCVSVYTGTASDQDVPKNTGVIVQNGVYQVVQLSKTYNYFYYNDECNLFEKFNCELYYYWVALKLGESCPNQYTKLCTIYNEFINKLKDDCHECM